MSDKLLVALRPTNTRQEVADAFVGIGVSSGKVEKPLFISNMNNKKMNGSNVEPGGPGEKVQPTVPCNVLDMLVKAGACVAINAIMNGPGFDKECVVKSPCLVKL